MCDDEDIKDSPFMAYIHPASGDYNPDLVSQCVVFVSPLLWLLASFPVPTEFPCVACEEITEKSLLKLRKFRKRPELEAW